MILSNVCDYMSIILASLVIVNAKAKNHDLVDERTFRETGIFLTNGFDGFR